MPKANPVRKPSDLQAAREDAVLAGRKIRSAFTTAVRGLKKEGGIVADFLKSGAGNKAVRKGCRQIRDAFTRHRENSLQQ